MKVDRTPGGFLDKTIQMAIRRARVSAETARALLDAGQAGPAYAWAVRSIEIFVKEVMLLPLYLEAVRWRLGGLVEASSSTLRLWKMGPGTP